MRDWLWKYGPNIIWQQLALKRDLKARGYYPSPLGDDFVRELTQQLLNACVINHFGETDKKKFRNLIRRAGLMVHFVIQNQHDLSSRVSMMPSHLLVMKHLGYFQKNAPLEG